MAASIISSAVVAPAQASMVAPFTGLKSTSAFPVTRKLDTDITSLATWIEEVRDLVLPSSTHSSTIGKRS
ncbi:hypothetical protein CsSME_00022380 [Camellia sinensis var. sinensis]